MFGFHGRCLFCTSEVRLLKPYMVLPRRSAGR